MQQKSSAGIIQNDIISRLDNSASTSATFIQSNYNSDLT